MLLRRKRGNSPRSTPKNEINLLKKQNNHNFRIVIVIKQRIQPVAGRFSTNFDFKSETEGCGRNVLVIYYSKNESFHTT